MRRRTLIPTLPRPAWVVLGGDALSALGSGLTMAFLFVYLTRVRHIDLEVAALAVATVALASFAGNPTGGSLSDRIGSRNTMVLGLALSALGAVAVVLVREAWHAFIATALTGLGASVSWPAQDALLATLVRPEQRSSVFAVRHATLNAGFGVGAAVAAAVVDLSRPGTFVAIYLLDALTFLLFIPVLFTLEDGRRPGPKDETAVPGGYREVVRDRVFLRLWVLTALLVTIGYGQLHAGFPGYAVGEGGIGPRGLAIAMAANTFTVVLAQLFVLRWLNGRRRTRAIVGLCALWAAAWGVTILAAGAGGAILAVAGFALAMVVFGLGETLLTPTIIPMVNDLAPQPLRGHYNGVGVLAWTTGFMLGPVIAGFALGRGAGTQLFVGLIGGCAVAAWLALRLEARFPASANTIGEHRTEGAETGCSKVVPAGGAS